MIKHSFVFPDSSVFTSCTIQRRIIFNICSNNPINIYDIVKEFQKKDINFLDHLPIVMSEKDASKCLHFKNPKIWYLTIEATVEDKFFEKLMEKINVKRRNP